MDNEQKLTLIFPSKNQYTITDTYNCKYIENLFEDNTNEPIYVGEYEDVFKNNILKQQVELSELKTEENIMLGLGYFGCVVLMNELYQKQRDRCKQDLQSEIDELLFEEFEWYAKYRPMDKVSKKSRLLHHTKFIEKYIKYVPLNTTAVPEKIMKDNLNTLDYRDDWVDLCKNPHFSEEFFKYLLQNHTDKISWSSLCSNTGLSEQFFRNILKGPHKSKICWITLCKNPSITEQFFRDMLIGTHKNNLYWISLCENRCLSEQFFRDVIRSEHKNKIEWYSLCYNPIISDQFCKDNITKLNWDALCHNPSISDEFIFKNANPRTLQWFSICSFSPRTDAFFQYYINHIKRYWCELVHNRHLSEKFFRDNADILPSYVWEKIADHPNISEQFIRDYRDKIYIRNVSGNPNLTENFFRENKDNLNLAKLSCNKNITENILRLYFKNNICEFFSDFLFCNNNLSEEFFLDFPETLEYGNTEYLNSNNNLSPHFIKEYAIPNDRFFDNDFSKYIERTVNKEFDLKFT